jgi:hypothetical protein
MFISYFESKDLTFFTAVLERACSDIQYLDESRREVIAARILHLAQTGERDFEALRKYAVASNLVTVQASPSGSDFSLAAIFHGRRDLAAGSPLSLRERNEFYQAA